MNSDLAAPPKFFERSSGQSRSGSEARRATATLFLVDGMTFGTWAALVPYFQERFGLTDGQLSWVLFGLVLGALISMPATGHFIAQRGSRAIAFPAALGFCAALTLPALAPNYAILIAAAVFFGAVKGAVDVSINAQAITVENKVARPIMSSFQAFWSLGGLGAAFLLSLAMNHGMPAPFLMLAMAAWLFLLTLSTLGRLLPDAPSRAAKPAGFFWPDSKLVRLGGLAFLALFSEGVLLDWSAVYARSVTGVSVAIAPIAFAAFALSMAGGRFLGDMLIARLGPVLMLRISGALMALGVALAVMVQTWPVVILGFATVGFGIANLVPILFGAAGRSHENGAGPGLATVTTLGYFGFLSGPPMIGVLAAAAGLPFAFVTVIAFGAIIATLGVSVIRPSLRSRGEHSSERISPQSALKATVRGH
jgi:MFS family permease